MLDVIVREIKMPLSVRAFTLLDNNGDYNVYINCYLSNEIKSRALEHEKQHIRNNDFDKLIPAHILEKKI